MNGSFFFASPYSLLMVFPVVGAVYILYRYVQNKETDKISAALDGLLYLSGITILLGALGFFLEMSRASCHQLSPGSSFVTIICTVPESPEFIQKMTSCYSKSASAMLTGLLFSMVLGLLWYVLHNRQLRS